MAKKIRPTQELVKQGWSAKELTVRKKLHNMLSQKKPVELKKIAYYLPRYEKVEKVEGQFVRNQGRRYQIWRGTLGSGPEEFFMVDIAECIDVDFGNGMVFALPYHIDLQRFDMDRWVKIGEVDIPWKDFFEMNGDVLEFFGADLKTIRKSFR